MSKAAAMQAIEAVVVGASAGAVEALLQVLPHLPPDYPRAVLVVVHLPPDFRSNLPELLASRCLLPVKEAEDKEPIRNGIVYVAPPNYHLLIEPGLHLSLSSDEPVRYSRPSIDVLFESAADVYGSAAAGVVLTGSNADGAAGLQRLAAAGGLALVQDPATAAHSFMPEAALEACPAARRLNLQELAAFLQEELP